MRAPFHPDWEEFWTLKDAQPFDWQSVNSRCSTVAEVYAHFMKLRGHSQIQEQYGFFLRLKTHPFWKNRPLARHAWVLIGEHTIHDPSRWCFDQDQEPYLWITDKSDPEYDVGMNRTKQVLFGVRPRPDFVGPVVSCPQSDIREILGGRIDAGQLAWLANQPPGSKVFRAEIQRRRVFRWIQKRFPAYVPWDNRVRL